MPATWCKHPQKSWCSRTLSVSLANLCCSSPSCKRRLPFACSMTRKAVGGLLHLRYVATSGNEPIDLTDNTLSSDLLLMDSFCKELRSAGARKQSWRVSIFGHTPQQPAMEGPAATVIDLAKAYFSDARLPVECKEFRRPLGVVVRMDAREGRIWVNGTPGSSRRGLTAVQSG